MTLNGTYQDTDELHEKLDRILVELERQAERQRELQMLQADLSLVGKDIFRTVVEELENLRPFFSSHDLENLVKKFLRNIRHINHLLDGLEQFANFLGEAAPLHKEMLQEAVGRLDQMDRKGYFDFGKELLQIVDTVVTSFTVEDVRLLRENVSAILNTVRSLTQPDMLTTMNNAVGFYKNMEIPVKKDISYRDIIKTLRDPEVKRGIAFMLQFVQNMASEESDITERPTALYSSTNGGE